MQPLVTIYEPERHGDRWIARADVNAKGEMLQLQVTASDKLARRAKTIYNRASHFVSKWVKFKGTGIQPGKGVFGDLPHVAHELANGSAIPYDQDVQHAAMLFSGCAAGHPEALEQLAEIERAAPTDKDAAAALEHLRFVDAVHNNRSALPMAAVFAGAESGNASAQRILAALRVTREPHPSPVRLLWDAEDYLHEPKQLESDLHAAAHDEFGARIVRPGALTSRRVRPSYQAPMLRTYQQILNAYTW